MKTEKMCAVAGREDTGEMNAREFAPDRNGKRKVFWITILCCLTVFLLLWCGKMALISSVERFAARQIQACALELTGREVYVGSISYNLWQKHLEIKHIGIPNPPGYPQKYPAVHIEYVSLKLASWEIFRNLVHIEEVDISGVKMNVSLKKLPKNFEELVKIFRSPEINLAKLKAASKRKNSREAQQEKSVSVKIDKLRITKIRAVLDLKWRLSLPLPDCTRTGLGTDGYMPLSQLTTEIFNNCREEMTQIVLRKARQIKQTSQKVINEAIQKIKGKYLSTKENAK